MKQRHPRNQALTLALDLVGQFDDVCERVDLAGSLRRQTETVGDIEIVAIPKLGVLTRETECDIFGKETVNEITGSLLWQKLDAILPSGSYTKRGEKYRQFAWKGIQVDLFTAERENWGWIYLVRTGSADFSHRIAATLNLRGYTSQLGYIRKKSQAEHDGIGTRIETPEEESVFKLAGVKYVDPIHRTR